LEHVFVLVSSQSLRQVIKRHESFWDLSPFKKPLLGKIGSARWKPAPYPINGGRFLVEPCRISPEDIDVEKLTGAERQEKPVVGDLILPLGCLYPEAWMEALIGCPIYASAYGCVAKPTNINLVEASATFSVKHALKSDWAEVMDQVLLKQKELAKENSPVRQLHQRGIIDMLAAFLGVEKLCLAIYDNPAELNRLAEKFTDLYIAVIQRGLQIRPRWQAGYVSDHNIYAPGILIDYQLDASSHFSRQMYEEHFLKHDSRILSMFPFQVVHMHACGLHVLDSILKIEQLRAIEIHMDRETGVWEKNKFLEYCKKIQEHSKCLIIKGELTEEELQEFISTLSPRGLAICYQTA